MVVTALWSQVKNAETSVPGNQNPPDPKTGTTVNTPAPPAPAQGPYQKPSQGSSLGSGRTRASEVSISDRNPVIVQPPQTEWTPLFEEPAASSPDVSDGGSVNDGDDRIVTIEKAAIPLISGKAVGGFQLWQWMIIFALVAVVILVTINIYISMLFRNYEEEQN
jgi:hypothetical protein